MADPGISRRDAGRIIASAAALTSIAPLVAPALGRQPAGKAKPLARGEFEKLLRASEKKDWTLRFTVNVQSFVEQQPKQMPRIHEFRFDSATVFFPILKTTGSSKVWTNEIKSTVAFDRALIAREWTELREDQQAGTRLARWDLKAARGRELEFKIEVPMTTWRTRFDLERALRVPWPSGPWPRTPQSALGPQMFIEHQNPAIHALVRQWTEKKDPKSIAPVELARWLASNVVELIQPSGEGLNADPRTGYLEGLTLRGAVKTLQDRQGTPHDVACLLTALYRAAGLPARVVIGFDERGPDDTGRSFLQKKSEIPHLRSWVEFCLYDEDSQRELWVPVDVNKQRQFSSRILHNLRSWRYFGDNDDLDRVMPFAFHYHPPTAAVAHGSVAFWGWLTVPQTQSANQFLRMDALMTPKTPTTDRDREAWEREEQRKATQPAAPAAPGKP